MPHPPSPYPLSGTLFPLAECLSSGLLLHRGGKVLYANRAMSRLSGFSPDELIDKDFWAFYPPRCGRHHPRARPRPAHRRTPGGPLRDLAHHPLR